MLANSSEPPQEVYQYFIDKTNLLNHQPCNTLKLRLSNTLTPTDQSRRSPIHRNLQQHRNRLQKK